MSRGQVCKTTRDHSLKRIAAHNLYPARGRPRSAFSRACCRTCLGPLRRAQPSVWRALAICRPDQCRRRGESSPDRCCHSCPGSVRCVREQRGIGDSFRLEAQMPAEAGANRPSRRGTPHQCLSPASRPRRLPLANATRWTASMSEPQTANHGAMPIVAAAGPASARPTGDARSTPEE